MNLRKLRRRCEARLRGLDIPGPYDIDTLVARLAEHRGRPLRLLPLPEGTGPGVPCGMWVATEHEDWVFVEPGTSPLHREHILLHEAAHMLCGHLGGRGEVSPPRLLADLDGDMVRRVLGRAGYTTEEEQEAELLATLIRARVRRADPPTAPTAAPGVAAVLGRAAHALRPDRD